MKSIKPTFGWYEQYTLHVRGVIKKKKQIHHRRTIEIDDFPMIFPFPAFLISVDNGDFPVPATKNRRVPGDRNLDVGLWQRPVGRVTLAIQFSGGRGGERMTETWLEITKKDRDFSRDRCDMYGLFYIRGYVWIKKSYKMENLEICNHH